MSTSELERRAIRESAGMGTALGAVLGAAAGAGISYATGNRSTGSLIAAGAGGAVVGGAVGHQAGVRQGVRQVRATRLSHAERQNMEARLRSARSSNAALASYNQTLESRIAQLKRTRTKPALQKVYTEAVAKRNATTNEIRSLQSFASTLPPKEQDAVMTAAAKLNAENDKTGTLVAQLSEMNYGVY